MSDINTFISDLKLDGKPTNFTICIDDTNKNAMLSIICEADSNEHHLISYKMNNENMESVYAGKTVVNENFIKFSVSCDVSEIINNYKINLNIMPYGTHDIVPNNISKYIKIIPNDKDERLHCKYNIYKDLYNIPDDADISWVEDLINSVYNNADIKYEFKVVEQRNIILSDECF